MRALSLLIPGRDERRHLGGFYISSFISELFNIVQPFQFVFLLLVMANPSWALIPLMVEAFAVFMLEIPTGIVADRWGRKISVILGDIISGVGWLIVPLALFLDDIPQLILLCFAFALEGLGQTLVSGAEEAWVVDNLLAVKRADLSDAYFARERSISSFGGILSGLATWALLSAVEVSAPLVASLWILAALGQLVSALLLIPIPERVISIVEKTKEMGIGTGTLNIGMKTLRASLAAFIRSKGLIAFTAVTLIISFATSITGDAFELSMITKGLNPKELAPLAVACDVLGFLAPVLVLFLARRFKLAKILVALLIITAIAALIFFVFPPLAPVVGLFLFFNAIDDIWDPIADVMLHSYLPSAFRATLGSLINQTSELMGMLGLGVFSLMLGRQGEELRDAIPGLVEAFQGEKVVIDAVPTSLFGLPVGDAVLVLMSFIGLSAAAILWFFPWDKSLQEVSSEELLGENTLGASSLKPSAPLVPVEEGCREKLLAIKKELDEKLERYNPGEQLTWWVSADAFSIPENTARQLRQIGPALTEFFSAAYTIMQTHPWVRPLLEKTFTPHYRQLNSCALRQLPRLIRPDVVCDKNWTVKLVELEITVGARADTAIMAMQYDLSPQRSFLKAYAGIAKELHAKGQCLALVTAPHPYFEDLPDDARAFAALLREREGVENIVVLTEENLSSLRFDGTHLVLNERFSSPRIIHVIDRFVDIYEIAEAQHAGIAAILDAYLAGAIYDINTCCQCLDEKQWLALFWHPDLQESWQQALSPAHYQLLRQHIPRTWIIKPGLKVQLTNGRSVPIEELGDVRASLRQFVVKESGTSTTASGAQAFYVLSEMDGEEIFDLLQEIFASSVEHVLQELIESPRIGFWAIDPETDQLKHQPHARFKMSPFYVDGKLSDIRFVASDKQYAVNDGDCVVGVVRC